jgi:hypothetical protein
LLFGTPIDINGIVDVRLSQTLRDVEASAAGQRNVVIVLDISRRLQ